MLISFTIICCYTMQFNYLVMTENEIDRLAVVAEQSMACARQARCGEIERDQDMQQQQQLAGKANAEAVPPLSMERFGVSSLHGFSKGILAVQSNLQCGCFAAATTTSLSLIYLCVRA
jgi:hypothetical protein